MILGPFVTAVGGTSGIPEVAARFSGGGFSNYFEQPSYQAAAVSGYLASLGTTWAGRYKCGCVSESFIVVITEPSPCFSRTGRAYPDVAAQAENFQVVHGGSTVSVAGTSCSAPVGFCISPFDDSLSIFPRLLQR